MKSPVEQSFYQGIVDALDFDWIENTYLTIEHGSKVPSYAVQMEPVRRSLSKEYIFFPSRRTSRLAGNLCCVMVVHTGQRD